MAYENRTEKISVNLTPSVVARLDAYREARRWTRSTAAAVLIEHGLDGDDNLAKLSGSAPTKPDMDALMAEYDVDQDQERRSR